MTADWLCEPFSIWELVLAGWGVCMKIYSLILLADGLPLW
jgi:hypothetical protein